MHATVRLPRITCRAQALLTDAVLKLKAQRPAEEVEDTASLAASAGEAVAPKAREREDVRLLATQPEFPGLEYLPAGGANGQQSAFLHS